MSNEIEPIENIPAPVERVIDQDSAKVFQVKSDVFFLDDAQHVTRGYFFTNCETVFKNPVPVKNDSSTLIGFASLSILNNIVSADICLDYSTPERLNIQVGSIPLFPHLIAAVESVDEVHTKRAKKITIEGILLKTIRTQDSRVLPL
jgi:hypothetical protein